MHEPEHIAAARDVYDYSAEQYTTAVGTEVSPRFETALDRAVLDAFAEQVLARAPGPVIDIGCGTGRVTAYLARRGLDVRGIDIAPGMIDAARAAHPQLRFTVGSLTDLSTPDASAIGAVYWYSIIATPLAALPAAWNELDRALTADGTVLIAFQAGDNDRVERHDAYGSSTTLTLYHHRVEDVAESLHAAGFEIRADLRRQAELSHETTSQAFLFTRRRPH